MLIILRTGLALHASGTCTVNSEDLSQPHSSSMTHFPCMVEELHAQIFAHALKRPAQSLLLGFCLERRLVGYLFALELFHELGVVFGAISFQGKVIVGRGSIRVLLGLHLDSVRVSGHGRLGYLMRALSVSRVEVHNLHFTRLFRNVLLRFALQHIQLALAQAGLVAIRGGRWRG